MASKFLRRSGIAVGLMMEQLNWVPELVVQVGIGFFHEEVYALRDEFEIILGEKSRLMKREWPNTTFLGFEAHPDSAKKIKDYPGEIRNKAISDRSGTVKLFSKRRHKDGSSLEIFNADIEDVQELEVACSTLDKEVEYEGNNALLWLDCEGSELKAMQGGLDFLKRVKVINIEMTPNPPSSCWPSTVDLHEFISQQGFYRQWIHTLRNGQYDAIYVRPDIFKASCCCCPYTILEFMGVKKGYFDAK